jgi:hypothetical protein
MARGGRGGIAVQAAARLCRSVGVKVAIPGCFPDRIMKILPNHQKIMMLILMVMLKPKPGFPSPFLAGLHPAKPALRRVCGYQLVIM